MDMREWAKKEVEIYKKENFTDDDFNYGNACVDSALKAFNSLYEDNHSGFSIRITQIMLNRLIDGKPLTKIEDIPENWDSEICDVSDKEKGRVCYNSNRMSGLFKYEYEDGKIEYKDVDRVIAVDINEPDVTFGYGGATRIVDELIPIEFPYYPSSKPYKVYMEDFLINESHGDFDVMGYYYIITPTGEKIDVNKYIYYPDGENPIEITKEEYDELKVNKINKEEF